MKSILMSIRPQWIAKILNGEKTIEIRKKFLKNYVGWVYIYCTKEKNNICLGDAKLGKLNGKVVARFWCDKAEEIKFETAPFDNNLIHWETETLSMFDICQKSCLSEKELYDYLQDKNGYAIHITKLEIFDKPKEISEFKIDITNKVKWAKDQTKLICKYRRLKTLTRAPQSWCYIEI